MNQERIIDQIKTLENVNFQLAELKRIKEELEATIIKEVEHDKVGQKTYIFDKYALTVKTEYNYILNKKEYADLDGESLIPERWNPIEETMVYKINKAQLKSAYEYAGDDVVALLDEFIKPSPAKPHIKIGAAV